MHLRTDLSDWDVHAALRGSYECHFPSFRRLIVGVRPHLLRMTSEVQLTYIVISRFRCFEIRSDRRLRVDDD
jgi:hypothetical protein